MNKNDYLNEFSSQLSSLDYQSKQDIISDFEEHFSIGLSSGKTEEQICAELGNPIENARQYLSGEKKVTFVHANKTANSATTAAPYSNTGYNSPYNPSQQANIPPRTNSTYTLLFALAIIIGIFFSFPVSFGFICAGIGICVAAGVTGAMFTSPALIAFFISLAVLFVLSGIILTMLNCWLIKICNRKRYTAA
ncbi:MAG: DUF1700 domain-containing protein [Clostridiales bacterium]|nr:DUF1700 domain-containing protein [Clostridiales bacterium]